MAVREYDVSKGSRAAEAGGFSVAFAKTTRPVASAAVSRERLFARLEGVPGRTLAWVSGPPGSGKTTLVASYLESRRMRCLWYQVDADDADPATFFHYLTHAARKLEGVKSRELPAYLAGDGADLQSFARKYFRQLFSRVRGPIALVLDNFQETTADDLLLRVLEAAIGQVPKQSCILVVSRSDPPVSLARYRVTGEMLVLGAESLRLDLQELGEIARLRGHALAADAAATLQERTRGWAAGIVLMLEHAKLSGRLADPPGGAPQAVFDYLAGEIFDQFEPRTRDFLLRIACLPRMTAEVARALSDEPMTGRLLVNLALNNYFVSEVQTEEGRVYQLHPLLRAFLRARAAQDLPAVFAPDHLRRAAGLLRAAGQAEDAVSLLVECRDWQELARLAAQEAPLMLSQGRITTLGGWLDLLPEALLESDPALLLALGECRARSAPRAARRRFEQALEAFRREGNADGALRSCCGLIDAIIFEFDDLAPLDRWRAILGDLLRARASAGAGTLDPAAANVMVRALLLRDAGSDELDEWIARARLPLARAASALLRGNLAAAGAEVEAIQAAARAQPAHVSVTADVAAALHYLIDGEHGRALAAARDAAALAEAEGVHGFDRWLRAMAAAASLGAGDRDGAREQIQLLEAARSQPRRGDRALLHYLRGWLAALEGDGESALREARAAVAQAADTGLPWLESLARGALARGMARAGDRRGCDAQLRAAEGIAQAQRSPTLAFFAGLAAAESALLLNEEAAVLAPLAAALALGREHGFRHAPWWRDREVAELCVRALRHGIEPAYVGGLVRQRNLSPRTPPLRVRDWPWAFRVRTLGGFDLARDGEPIEVSGKGPGRPVELLKVLIAMGGMQVRADQLADALWPHVDADYAHKSFTTALHRLRRLLGEDEAVQLRDGRLSLDAGRVWVDVWALEQVIVDFEEGMRGRQGPDADGALGALSSEALALYRGAFLADETEQPSFLACREQIRARLLRCLARAAREQEEAGKREAAVDCYLRFIDADPVYEAPYRNLMLVYQRGGELAEARAIYERLRTMLAARLRSLPSAETQAVYAALALKPGA